MKMIMTMKEMLTIIIMNHCHDHNHAHDGVDGGDDGRQGDHRVLSMSSDDETSGRWQ